MSILQDIMQQKKKISPKSKKGADIPSDLFVKCPKCKKSVYKKEVKTNHKTCPFCGHLFRLSAQQRIDLICDENSWHPLDLKIVQANPLDFPEYDKKLEKSEKLSGLKEAVICGIAKIGGEKTYLCIMDSKFMMGSMGSVVGELLTQAIEQATADTLPIVIYTASGGARMQEGIISLMQMAKVSGALAKHSEAGLLYITVITDPTTGGVTASFASLGDIILAEKGALIGFAGRRVIEQTIRQNLPENFQTAEFLLEKGFIDHIVDRKKQKDILAKLLMMHKK